ncbi:hypothetical protein Tco_0670566 [Tanacetum coccineum]
MRTQRKCKMLVLKQQFEAFTISSKESLEKGYDRFQKLLSQLDALGAGVSDEDANHKFLRSLPPAWDNNTTATPGLADEVIHSFLATNADDVDLIHEDLDQIDDLDLEEMDINWQIAMTAIKIKKFYKKTGSRRQVAGRGKGQNSSRAKLEKEALIGPLRRSDPNCDSYNALQAKYDELQSEFGDQEAALVAHKLAVKKLESQLKASHKQQSSLNEKLKFQANQIFEKDEKLKKYRRIGMKVVKDKDALQKIVDSWFASSKNLWKLIDCGMSSTVKIGLGYGIKSNAEVLGYEEEISRGIFAFRETNAGYNDIPLYSRFKQVEYKGVPHPLSGDYTPREQEDIDDSLYEYGKYRPQPQSLSPTVSNASSIVFSICPSNDSNGELGAVSDASSTHYSTCQSNDSDGELGTVSDHSVNDDPIHDHIPIPSIKQLPFSTQKDQPQMPKPTQQKLETKGMERDLGVGYSFERKPCFVCGSLSHLIKDCDYYEKKMAREAALKSKRVFHADVRQATPAWTNANRVNKANQFTPRPVQLSNIRPNRSTVSRTVKTGRVNVNTGHGNVNSGNMHVNSGTQIKFPLKHMELGDIFDSGCSGHMTGKEKESSYSELKKLQRSQRNKFTEEASLEEAISTIELLRRRAGLRTEESIAQVRLRPQYYTIEDWDLIRQNLKLMRVVKEHAWK